MDLKELQHSRNKQREQEYAHKRAERGGEKLHGGWIGGRTESLYPLDWKCMKLFALGLVFPFAMQAQAPPDTLAILKSVEKRYNAVDKLQASFTQVFRDRGRPHPPQTGTLYLSKPGRTRWDYTGDDAGNFFLSDGKYTYYYDKRANSVERQLFKETEDQRIPLAFILGKLDFLKDFEKFNANWEDAGNVVIHMTPHNKNLLFRDIILTVAPDSSIRRVIVNGQEGSVMEYSLSGEQRNPKLPDSLFKFSAPPSAQVVDVR